MSSASWGSLYREEQGQGHDPRRHLPEGNILNYFTPGENCVTND